MAQSVTNSFIIVVQYLPSSPKRFIRDLGDGHYEEVSDAALATTFFKRKSAIQWIEENFGYKNAASVENARFFLTPHKGNL